MKNVKKNYYLKKNQVLLSREQFDTLCVLYGWNIHDMMLVFRISYNKAREIFNNVKKKYGTLPFDNKQVSRLRVFDYFNMSGTRKIHFTDEFDEIPLSSDENEK